jgi:ADP-heptose:LPS heptosyltransferase
VRRDLDLVAAVGAFPKNESLRLEADDTLWQKVTEKLNDAGVNTRKPWLILHAGVSEKKREYPLDAWAKAARKLIVEKCYQILLTGSPAERELTGELEDLVGADSVSLSGIFNLEEYICLVKHAPVMLSVNTGTVHIAAAVGTPVVVLYAQTNPQHTPWQVPNRVLPFPVPEDLRSKNEVIVHVNNTLYNKPIAMPTAQDIVNAVDELLNLPDSPTPLFHEIPNENQVIAAS